MNQPHKYEYDVNVYAESAAAKVVRMVGKDKRVLEIGAGPGSITRLLKERGGNRVVAVERDESAIEQLSAFCERVYRLDLDDAGWTDKACAEGRFEVVVAADVLEHLFDPWTTLKSLLGVLAPGGYAVVSLPHAGHNALIGSLLSGQVGYRDSGLLDRTHVRFFCVRDMQALFEQAGFKIVDAEFVVRKVKDTELADRFETLPVSLRKELEHNRFGEVYQVVIKAVPADAPGARVDLSAMPIPGYAQWAPGTPLRVRALFVLRPLARMVLPLSVREAIGRGLRRLGWLE